MTEAEIIPFGAMASRAMKEAVTQGREADEVIDPIAEFQKVLGKPIRVAATLVAPADVKAERVTDARSPATLDRVALAALLASADPQEDAMRKALDKAGVSREMLPQVMESPDFLPTFHKVAAHYIVGLSMMRMTSAMTTLAENGNVSAFKALMEVYRKGDEGYDEQTKAMAEADPATRVRHTKALIEDLQRLVNASEGAAANKDAVEVARAKAIGEAQDRKDSLRK